MSDDIVARTPFIYDALRKVAVARVTARDGRAWTLEIVERRPDDAMDVVVRGPDGATQALALTEEDFVFSDGAVTVRGLAADEFVMPPLYLKKLRGFTRGNIPTPDIPGPSLP